MQGGARGVSALYSHNSSTPPLRIPPSPVALLCTSWLLFSGLVCNVHYFYEHFLFFSFFSECVDKYRRFMPNLLKLIFVFNVILENDIYLKSVIVFLPVLHYSKIFYCLKVYFFSNDLNCVCSCQAELWPCG